MTATRNTEPLGVGINGLIPGEGKCVMEGCRELAKPDRLMCIPHWRKVSEDDRINLQYMLGRFRMGRVSLFDVREAQWRCVESVK